MTKKARLQTKPATPKPTISLSRPSILQRTCACGGVPGLTGECEACSSQRLSRSPGATNPSTLADRSSNDHATAQSQQSPLSGYSFRKLAIEPQERLGIQAKLAIGQPGDKYEQEADLVADQVMRMPAPEKELQRQSKKPEEDEEKKKRLQMQPLQRQVKPTLTEEDEEKKKRLQMKSKSAAKSEASPDLQERISGLQQGGGQPLSTSERAFFEPRFGQDFSQVRLHTDGQTADLAQAVNARAFTVGRDVVFGAGQYQPRAPEGQSLLAHELTHVVQQSQGSLRLARQTVEQYETKGITLDQAEIQNWAGFSYWEQKVMKAYSLSVDPHFSSASAEEKNAVLSSLWQSKPTQAIQSETPKIVSIPKRVADPKAKDLIYKFVFKPKATPKDLDTVEVIFVAEDSAATAIATTVAPTGFIPQQPSYNYSGFPGNDADKYWKAHPEEHQRVFHWIEKVAAQTFDQVITTSFTVTKNKKTATQEASFHVEGSRDASGNIASLTITFLGSGLPTTQTPATNYNSKDFADLQIEEAQTKQNPRKKDKLGIINGLIGLPPDEQLSVKFAVWQYFQGGTRNAEVDAIVPIPATQKKQVLYTLRFQPKTNNVDVVRIGEEGKDVNLITPKLSIARASGFAAISKNVTTLKVWLSKRYPAIKPTGDAADKMQENADKELQANAGKGSWFKTNYGIEILDAGGGSNRLTTAHQYQPAQLADLKDFTASELILLESTLQTMSDPILAMLKGVQMIRQEVSIEASGKTFKPQPQRTGLTLHNGSDRSVIIFDAANMNNASLFLGGKGTGTAVVQQSSTMTFAHELGHVVYEQSGIKKAFDDFVKKKKIKPITWYAASSIPKELYPEAFALYQLDPEWLKTNWSDLYSWFDTLAKTGSPPPP